MGDEISFTMILCKQPEDDQVKWLKHVFNKLYNT